MLVGRDRELASLSDLVEATTSGGGGALLVRGEPGSGKTALLDHLQHTQSGRLSVLRTTGVPAVGTLAFAGLADVLLPLREHLDELAPNQRIALEVALALRPGPGGDALAVAAGGLALLTAAARRRPVLVLVDDVQWLDAGSRAALSFAAWRVGGDAVAIVAAARDGSEPAEWAALPQLPLHGLDPAAAATLLTQSGHPVHPAVLDQLLELTGGNPLALQEAAATATPEQRDGQRALTWQPSIGYRVEQAFAQRLADLDEPARTAVLLVALDRSTRRPVLTAASQELGLAQADFAAAQPLFETSGATLRIRHPLIRAAAVAGSTTTQRARAHRALAAALDPATEAELRTWHLAAAADAPDEELAAALEAIAAGSLARADLAAAVAGFQRAAELSPERSGEARRLWAAGLAGLGLGTAESSLARAQELTDDPGARGLIVVLRATAASGAGDHPLLARLLREHGEELAATNPVAAAALFAAAATGAWSRADFAEFRRLAARGAALLPPDQPLDGPHLLAPLIAVIANLTVANFPPDGAAGALAAAQAARADALLPLGPPVLYSLITCDQLTAAEDLRDLLRTRSRDSGQLLSLAWLDAISTKLFQRRGDLVQAHATGTAALDALSEHTSTAGGGYAAAEVQASLAIVDALGGLEESCRARAESAQRSAVRLGTDIVALEAAYALALLELGHGRHITARQSLVRLQDDLTRRGMLSLAIWPALGDLVEARELAGELAEAREALALVRQRARHDALPYTRLIAARAELVLAEPAELSARFEQALGIAEDYGNPFEQARTRLVYGRRRELDPTTAVEQLVVAAEQFRFVGAHPWAERAADALQALGRPRPASPAPLLHVLSDKEQQVAGLAITGQSTRDIAAELLISPKTVETHLTSIYRKLGVRSKAQLAHLLGSQAR